MPNRVPLRSVCVVRGTPPTMFTPPIGQVFEFTDDEVADIERASPDALSDQVSVDANTVEAKPAAAGKSGKSGKAKGEEL